MLDSQSLENLRATLKLAEDIGLYNHKQFPAAAISTHKSKNKISQAQWRIIAIKMHRLQQNSSRKDKNIKQKSKLASYKRQLDEKQQKRKNHYTQSFCFKQDPLSTKFSRIYPQTARVSLSQGSPRLKNASLSHSYRKQQQVTLKTFRIKEHPENGLLSDRQKRNLLLNISNDISLHHSLNQNPQERIRFIKKPNKTMKLKFNKKSHYFQFSQ